MTSRRVIYLRDISHPELTRDSCVCARIIPDQQKCASNPSWQAFCLVDFVEDYVLIICKKIRGAP